MQFPGKPWACVPCNRRKGNRPAEDFLKRKPEVQARIKRQAKAPLKNAAAVNSTRWELFRRLKATGLPVKNVVYRQNGHHFGRPVGTT